MIFKEIYIRVEHPKLCLDRMIPMGVESTDMLPPGLVSAASLRAIGALLKSCFIKFHAIQDIGNQSVTWWAMRKTLVWLFNPQNHQFWGIWQWSNNLDFMAERRRPQLHEIVKLCTVVTMTFCQSGCHVSLTEGRTIPCSESAKNAATQWFDFW